ncbi:methyl-accepting chemotaxis protein [Yersinia ruckeri]|uniref:methyl-accepting chemotaxis protein n=1 Tax=Yersinia ruckeri TaxID=29486 RepID=UPI00119F6088|nr:methyl-accepting chemotaxis protein [Yersinia ruckeri]EKN3360438.1 Tar ligand binding domain-containing protein [Yersinia ruckeri]EKN4200176.1 Tar ligand binding domain-containing protein [Yersinia ruckeri]EKN4206767.1 Tar ligand binding domain-containing protein [Yersinia ruckeri]EKN4724609.1 Tar ligand binding domain-containing protein [Yersinia ruckeri]ELM3747351.1 Tar ligand binding domain-containing protein [Yersinia ruckeri]
MILKAHHEIKLKNKHPIRTLYNYYRGVILMFKEMKISVGLSLIICAFSLALLGMGGFSIQALTNSKGATFRIDRIQGEQLAPLYVIYSDLLNTRIYAQNAALLLAEKKDTQTELEKATSYFESTQKNMAALSKIVALTEEGRRLRRNIDKAYTDYVDNGINPMIQTLRNGDLVAYYNLGPAVVPKSEVFHQSVTEFDTFSKALGEREINGVTASYWQNMWIVGATLLLTLALIVITINFTKKIIFSPINEARRLFAFMAKGDLSNSIPLQPNTEMGGLLTALDEMQQSLRSIVTRVRESSAVITVGTRQISAGNQDFSSRTEEQAASVEQTAASMEQLTSSVKQNRDSTQLVTAMADNMSVLARKNGTNIADITNNIVAINQSSEKISNIIGVIDSISFQTNILALNAAVEAARAGEAGKGFAVVASEVRNLAQRSAVSAKEIKELIEDSVHKIKQGSDMAAHSSEDMKILLDEVDQVKDFVGSIAMASDEQSRGIEQVNIAIAQLEQIAQQNAALVEEASAATDSLADQADTLDEVMQIFTLSKTMQ